MRTQPFQKLARPPVPTLRAPLPCRLSVQPVPSWKAGQTGQGICGPSGGGAFGKASMLAALLLPSTTQWGQGERCGHQTHDDKHTDAGSPGLPAQHFFSEPRSQTCSRPDRGYTVSKMAPKAMLCKISLCLVRWEGERGCLLYLAW